jgi:hypothetical protein
MGSSKQETSLAINTLKRIDIDRTRIEPKKNATNNLPCSDTNPFELNDDEYTRPDSALLAHIVQDISEVCFDDVELDIKICDLMAHSRKSKASRKKGHNSNKKLVSKWKDSFGIAEVFQTWLNTDKSKTQLKNIT